jgi:hypothetical protein
MTVFLTAIDTQQQISPFTVINIELDQVFDLVNRIIINGHRLLSIQIQDKGLYLLELPVEAFNGQDMSQAMQDLKQQWQEALGQTTAPGL